MAAVAFLHHAPLATTKKPIAVPRSRAARADVPVIDRRLPRQHTGRTLFPPAWARPRESPGPTAAQGVRRVREGSATRCGFVSPYCTRLEPPARALAFGSVDPVCPGLTAPGALPLAQRLRLPPGPTTVVAPWGHFFKWGACRAGGCEAACRQGEGRHVWKGGRRVPVHPPKLDTSQLSQRK